MIRVIVTDIEGTTSSIRFVHDVLFPYAVEALPTYVRAHDREPAVREQLDAVAAESGIDPYDIEGLIEQLLAWIREDRKATPLKALQGMIWQRGYERGDFKGHIYDDAAEYLCHWHDEGFRLYVYSSGSVQAQKLLFGYSEAGDLTPFFSGYFDTRIGGKKDDSSYRHILEELGMEPQRVLFLSDVEEELEAAEKAGLQTCWLVRQGALPNTERPVARDFAEVHRLLLSQPHP
ncbi:acireductone synthase [Marinobacteraceae bacterium S3BR75-40.1]